MLNNDIKNDLGVLTYIHGNKIRHLTLSLCCGFAFLTIIYSRVCQELSISSCEYVDCVLYFNQYELVLLTIRGLSYCIEHE